MSNSSLLTSPRTVCKALGAALAGAAMLGTNAQTQTTNVTQLPAVVVTGSFIPIEIYELVKDFGVGKVVALIVNVAIVIYLAWRRLEERKGAFNKIRHALGAS